MQLEDVVSRQTFELKSEVIQAGAGTGKTHSLTEKVFEVIEKTQKELGRYPRLLVCTFTRKATQELKERLYKKALESENWEMLDYIHSPNLHISTIHGIFSLLLQKHGYQYGISSDFNEFSSQQEEMILNQLASKFLFQQHFSLLKQASFSHLSKALREYSVARLKNPKCRLLNKEDLKRLKAGYEKVRTEGDDLSVTCLTQAELEKSYETKEPPAPEESFLSFFKEFETLAQEFFTEFIKQKKSSGVLAINDLELWTLDLLRKKPAVAKSFAKDWDYWFIDEYQDTSWIQEQIISKITQFKNVFCVGDPKQSIYIFRGADPEVFNRRIESCKGQITNLETNRRSQASLIHFFNDFFPVGKGFLKLKPLDSKKTQTRFSPAVSFLCYEDTKEKPPEEGDEEELTSNSFKGICSHIQKLIKKGASYKDICVLGFQNDHLLQLSHFLRSKKLPVELHSKTGFSSKRVILDSLFLLKFLMNPYDDENLVALLRTPYFRIADLNLSQICHSWYLENKKDVKDPSSSSQTKKQVSLWNFLLKHHKDSIVLLEECQTFKKEKGICFAFEKSLFETGFMDLIEMGDASGMEEANLWKLIYLVRDRVHSMKNPLSLYYSLSKDLQDSEFLFQNAFAEAPSYKEEANFVSLMTVHSSKGLEFEHVIIFNLTKKEPREDNEMVFNEKEAWFALSASFDGTNTDKQKCLPHKVYNREQTKKRMEEKERYLYVAMTRAVQTLTILTPLSQPKHIWFEKFPFFTEKFLEIDGKKMNLKVEGLQKEKNYNFLVERVKDETLLSENEEEEASVKLPLKIKKSGFPAVKTVQDFIKDTHSPSYLEEEQPGKLDFNFNRVKNTFFSSYKGNRLHNYLKLLSQTDLDFVLEKVSCSYLNSEDKKDLSKAIQWVFEQPQMGDALKLGFPEWSFQLNKKNVLLKGRIDLWCKKEDEIWIFDYKSSNSKSQEVKKQLVFYACILEEIYKPKKIRLFGVYPFQKEIKEWECSMQEKKEFIPWLEKVALS